MTHAPARAGRADRPDAGMTVVEVVVAMSVLGVLLAAFASTVTLMTSTTRKVYATADVSTQSRGVLDVLSRQLAYASVVNTPTRTATAWYVEFRSDAVLAGTNPRCTQWRYTPGTPTGQLQYRTWDPATLAATDWSTLATSMVNDPVSQPPFALLPSDSGFTIMRMVVDLRLRSTVGTVVQSQGQYAMRNSLDAPVPTASTVCTELGRP